MHDDPVPVTVTGNALDDLFDQVESGETLAITRSGSDKPMAVLMSYSDYEEMVWAIHNV